MGPESDHCLPLSLTNLGKTLRFLKKKKKLSKCLVVFLFLFLLPLGPLLLQLLGEVLHPTSHLGSKLFQTRLILKLLRFAHIW